MNRRENVIWAAGFIDGEGSIYVARKLTKGRSKQWLRLCACQCSIEPLLLLQRLWGGHIRFQRTKATCRGVFEWSLCSRKAATAIAELEPFLVVKARHAKLALQFAKLVPMPGCGRASAEDMQVRMGIASALASLARGGPITPEKKNRKDGPPQLRLMETEQYDLKLASPNRVK